MMSMRTELAFIYDKNMRLISAKCKQCGEEMPDPSPELALPADIVMWFSVHFLEHKQHKHPQTSHDSASRTST